MDSDFLTFLAIGFFAQLVDGALGMAFGVISTTAMLSLGLSPAHASAVVHTAEVFTTGASAVSARFKSTPARKWASALYLMRLSWRRPRMLGHYCGTV